MLTLLEMRMWKPKYDSGRKATLHPPTIVMTFFDYCLCRSSRSAPHKRKAITNSHFVHLWCVRFFGNLIRDKPVAFCACLLVYYASEWRNKSCRTFIPLKSGFSCNIKTSSKVLLLLHKHHRIITHPPRAEQPHNGSYKSLKLTISRCTNDFFLLGFL